MTRRERIVFLLEHLPDTCGPSATGDGVGTGDGPGFVLTSSMAEHPSVVELGRCLRLLRRMGRTHSDDLETYYGSAWYVQRTPRYVERKGKRVQLREPDGSPVYDYQRKRGLPAWLKQRPRCRETGCGCGGELPRTVCVGVHFLACAFNGPVFIPEQLLCAKHDVVGCEDCQRERRRRQQLEAA